MNRPRRKYAADNVCSTVERPHRADKDQQPQPARAESSAQVAAGRLARQTTMPAAKASKAGIELGEAASRPRTGRPSVDRASADRHDARDDNQSARVGATNSQRSICRDATGCRAGHACIRKPRHASGGATTARPRSQADPRVERGRGLKAARAPSASDAQRDPRIAEQEDDDDDRHEHGRADETLTHQLSQWLAAESARAAGELGQRGVERGRRKSGHSTSVKYSSA